MRPVGQNWQLFPPGLLVVVVDVVNGAVAEAIVIGGVAASLHSVAGVAVHVLAVPSGRRRRKFLAGRNRHRACRCVHRPGMKTETTAKLLAGPVVRCLVF
jgi:hypothetical protein